MRSAIVLLFMLLAACGQSGALYLPSEPAPEPAAQTPGEESPTPEEDKEVP